MSDDEHGQPNPILNALSNAVAAVRADEDHWRWPARTKRWAPRPSKSSTWRKPAGSPRWRTP